MLLFKIKSNLILITALQTFLCNSLLLVFNIYFQIGLKKYLTLKFFSQTNRNELESVGKNIFRISAQELRTKLFEEYWISLSKRDEKKPDDTYFSNKTKSNRSASRESHRSNGRTSVRSALRSSGRTSGRTEVDGGFEEGRRTLRQRREWDHPGVSESTRFGDLGGLGWGMYGDKEASLDKSTERGREKRREGEEGSDSNHMTISREYRTPDRNIFSLALNLGLDLGTILSKSEEESQVMDVSTSGISDSFLVRASHELLLFLHFLFLIIVIFLFKQ